MVASLPSKQTAAVLRGPYGDHHSIENDYPVTPPGRTEVLVRIEAAGICAGDVNPRDGTHPAPPTAIRPLVPGHEGIGHIVALGEEVRDFSVGDRVGTGWRRSTCHICDLCKAGRDNLCPALVINGFVKDGTFQQYVVLPAADIIRIPSSNRPASELAPLLCAGGTALGGVRAANLSPGDWMCVTGAAGGVGLLAIQYAKHLGCRVIAIDSIAKKAQCEKFGAVFVDYEDSDTVVQRVQDISNDSVRGTVVCSANSKSYEQAMAWSGVGASVVCIGIAMIHMHVVQLMRRDIQLRGQANGRRKDIEDALALSNQGIVPLVEVVELESLDKALDKVKQGRAIGRQVLVFR